MKFSQKKTLRIGGAGKLPFFELAKVLLPNLYTVSSRMGVTSLSFAKLDLGSVNNLNCFWLPCRDPPCSNKMTPSKRKMTHNIDYVSACLKVMPIILSSSR